MSRCVMRALHVPLEIASRMALLACTHNDSALLHPEMVCPFPALGSVRHTVSTMIEATIKSNSGFVSQ